MHARSHFDIVRTKRVYDSVNDSNINIDNDDDDDDEDNNNSGSNGDDMNDDNNNDEENGFYCLRLDDKICTRAIYEYVMQERTTYIHMQKRERGRTSGSDRNDITYKSKERIDSEWRIKIEDSFAENAGFSAQKRSEKRMEKSWVAKQRKF